VHHPISYLQATVLGLIRGVAERFLISSLPPRPAAALGGKGATEDAPECFFVDRVRKPDKAVASRAEVETCEMDDREVPTLTTR
jgi:hypothetical protein